MELEYSLFLLVSFPCLGFGEKLPSAFKICKRDDPELNNCFARAIEHALPYLKEPIPEIKLPSINPGIIESAIVAPGAQGIVNVTQKLNDITVFNLINSKINKTELTLGDKEHKAVIYLYNSLIKTEADYDFEGTILSVPMFGKGRAYMDLYDIEIPITLTGKPYKKNNETYVKINEVKLELHPTKVIFDMENLFDGNKKLGDELISLINENWDKVFSDLKEPYGEILAAFLKSVFEAVYDRVPYDQLFPL